MNVCLMLSGSIGAYKACDLASRLVKAGHAVQCVASKGALRFVGVASLEGITDRQVYTDLWAPRESKTHISLRRWADLFIFYPATANRINQFATGLAPDLLGATFLANNFEKPFWIAPAMNTNMFRHPATQASLEKLQGWGCRIILGEPGRLACGDVGEGRLAEPQLVSDLVATWGQTLAAESSRGRVLISGGAMTEALDGVRSLTNSSSGRTATAIARTFLEHGWEVDYLHHETADLGDLGSLSMVLGGSSSLELKSYAGYLDFREELAAFLAQRDYQAIIHAAAVSDYRVALGDGASRPAKLESSEELAFRLVPNPKILPQIRGLAKGSPCIVAFKLTVGASEEDGRAKAQAFLDAGSADAVVWNDLEAMKAGSHPFVVFDRGAPGAAELRPAARGVNNQELASSILDLVEGHRT